MATVISAWLPTSNLNDPKDGLITKMPREELNQMLIGEGSYAGDSLDGRNETTTF